MGYEEDPDYQELKNLFKKIMERYGYADDKLFDWMLNKNSANNNTDIFNVI